MGQTSLDYLKWNKTVDEMIRKVREDLDVVTVLKKAKVLSEELFQFNFHL